MKILPKIFTIILLKFTGKGNKKKMAPVLQKKCSPGLLSIDEKK